MSVSQFPVVVGHGVALPERTSMRIYDDKDVFYDVKTETETEIRCFRLVLENTAAVEKLSFY